MLDLSEEPLEENIAPGVKKKPWLVVWYKFSAQDLPDLVVLAKAWEGWRQQWVPLPLWDVVSGGMQYYPIIWEIL